MENIFEICDAPAGELQHVQASTLTLHGREALVPELDKRVFSAFCAEVKAVGRITVALHVTDHLVVLDGRNRLRAAQEVGIATVPVIVYRGLSEADELLHIVRSSIQRRHLSQSQRAAMVVDPDVQAAVLNEFQARAKLRQVEGGRRKVRAKLPDASLQTRSLLATMAGVSPRTISDALYAQRHLPERMAAIRAGRSTESVSGVAKAVHDGPDAEQAGQGRRKTRRPSATPGSIREKLTEWGIDGPDVERALGGMLGSFRRLFPEDTSGDVVARRPDLAAAVKALDVWTRAVIAAAESRGVR